MPSSGICLSCSADIVGEGPMQQQQSRRRSIVVAARPPPPGPRRSCRGCAGRFHDP
jgi:hypothetical protein